MSNLCWDTTISTNVLKGIFREPIHLLESMERLRLKNITVDSRAIRLIFNYTDMYNDVIDNGGALFYVDVVDPNDVVVFTYKNYDEKEYLTINIADHILTSFITASKRVPVLQCAVQGGGGRGKRPAFRQFIVNPRTGRRVLADGRVGRTIRSR